MEDGQVEEAENCKEPEVAPALIALHPTQKFITVAVGSELRVFDLELDSAVSLADDVGGPCHSDSVRTIKFSSNGNLFVSAGDDKLVKVWTTDDWRCILTVGAEKRVTAVAISKDGLFVCYADKFGTVWVFGLDEAEENQKLKTKKPVALLAHYCSIITRLEFSPDGRFILSADRDFKIRVTLFPKSPLHGAHEIQSFCLGHIEFVSCMTFISSPDHPQGFIVSGSGDSTVRLWDISSGKLLYTCAAGAEAGLLESDGKAEPDTPLAPITDVCSSFDGTLVAVAIQGLQGIAMLNCDLSAATLSINRIISFTEETFIPTALGTSAKDYLWMVTGVSNLKGFDLPSLARVKVLSGFNKNLSNSAEGEGTIVEDSHLPGGEKLLEKLQGSLSVRNEAFLAAAEAVKTAMCNLLIKKSYTMDTREFRKRTRNDKKTKK
uniref:tRNA (guanine-N(7)-)-methyltransferase non-catalytic subunit n=1 Tax=Kalanchoe fedtschenkoi TaxID=63787 RepID=A0A7N0SYE8_KALFE